MSIIDANGYRAGVAIVLMNQSGQFFWGKRLGQESWQFPQGGIQVGESPLIAMYRELKEETGLSPNDVDLIASTEDWLSYDIPVGLLRQSNPMCIGQRQKWFLLRLTSNDQAINFDQGEKPEFDDWQWVERHVPLQDVIDFKRPVYEAALMIFEKVITQ